jgi:ATP-binding cassette, subfamily B, bacterial AbcA/BmrA
MHKHQRTYYRNIIQEHPAGIGVSILLSILESASLLPLALLVNQVFDNFLPNGNVTNLYRNLGIITALLLLNALMQLLNKRLTLNIIKQSIAHLRKSLIRSILSYSRLHLSQKDRDLLQSQVVQDTLRVDGLFTSILTQFIPGVLITVGLAVVLGSINVLLFILFLGLTPVIGLLSVWISRKFRKEVRAYHQSFSGFSKGISFILRFNELIHTSSAEAQEIGRQDASVEALRESQKRAAWLSALLGVIQRQTLMISGVVVLLVGGLFVISGANTLGELISFYVAVGLVNSYARSSLGAIPTMLEGRESMKRIRSILEAWKGDRRQGKETGNWRPEAGKGDGRAGKGDRRPEAGGWERRPETGDGRPETGGKESTSNRGIVIDKIVTVEFRQVTFGYSVGEERSVLKDLSFSCRIGDFFLVRGPSGIGKSTLLYLLLGFYRPQSGEIFINATPLGDLDIHSVRRLIGFVGQEPMLFPETILENLTYGLGGTSLDEKASVEDAASEKLGASGISVGMDLVGIACGQALIDDFIKDLPDQYESFIGEQGMLISGGQRQRLAIARALLRKPQILILDEPENNLPQGMMDQILDNMDLEQMITILITHRAGGAEEFSRKRGKILVLELG